MGLLDDAIREHLELKRRHGADASEVAHLEREAFGPAADAPEPLDPVRPPASAPADPVLTDPLGDPPAPAPAEPAREVDLGWEDAPAPPPEPIPGQETMAFDAAEAAAARAEAPDEDVLEETPEFLQETPEHERLWFEQRPPRDFDFDG